MIFVNFKTYPQAMGDKAVKLVQICEKISQESGISIIPCVQAVDLSSVVKAVKIPVWVQYIDPVLPGKKTGFVTALAVKNAGGKGALVNHSEHPLKLNDIKMVVKLTKENSLKTMVLVSDLETAKKVDKLAPDYIGIEEPSLIGTGVAMVNLQDTKQKIINFVKVIKNSYPLVGAGINSSEDISTSLDLGAKGVLVSSAVVLAPNPEEVLRQMAAAFHN
jgi:triosephosphate isomerase